MRVREVFVPGGQPTVTYVDRVQHELEKRVSRALARGYSIVSITGPTKCGKTVLCRRVIGTDSAIWVEGGLVKDENDFWMHVGSQIEATRIHSVSETTSDNTALGANAIAKFDTSTSSTYGTSAEAVNRNKDAVFSLVRESGKHIVIDDFHYIDRNEQTQIIRSLKSLVFNGNDVFLLPIPHHAHDTIQAEPEMSGRFQHIEIPTWDRDELKQIASEGFPALRVRCDDRLVENMVDEAFGSPMLMQTFCSDLCIDRDILETQSADVELSFNAVDMTAIYERTSRDAGYPIFRKLSQGPQSRSDRIPRHMVDGTSGDIYQAVLKAIAETGPEPEIQYDILRTQLRNILVEQPPQKHEITNALRHMARIAKEEIEGEPPIEWDQDNDMLYITSPYLIFYMRWQHRLE